MKQVHLRIYFWLRATLGAFQSPGTISFGSTEDKSQLLREHVEMVADPSNTQEQNPTSSGDRQKRLSFRTKITKRVHQLYTRVVLKTYERRLKEINEIEPGKPLKVSWMKDLALALPKTKIDKLFFYVFVQQPIPGQAVKMNFTADVGHSFIGLKVMGKSSTDIVNHVFGYYPKPDRQKILSGTPFENKAEACFLDDSFHSYHLRLWKEITLQQHVEILNLAEQFEKRTYDLRSNNCTDFVIEAAKLAGIVLHKTAGDWVVGEGNNPADLGQAILFGLYYDKVTKHANDIIVDKQRVLRELRGEA